MKSTRWIAVGVALVLALTGAWVSLGESLTLPGLRGGELTEAELSSGKLVVVLWASWSPRGRDVASRVNELAASLEGKARVVAVNFQEDRATAEGFVAEHPFRVPVYLDQEGSLARRYRLTQLPGLLVLSDGESKFAGALPADPARTVLDALP